MADKVLMTGCGDNKAAVIQALIKINDWNFMQALRFTDDLPGEIELDEEQKALLESAGAVFGDAAEADETTSEEYTGVEEGQIRIEYGYMEDWMAGAEDPDKVVLRDAYVLMADSIESVQELMPVLEHVIKENGKILMIAESIGRQVLDTLKINKDQHILDSVCVSIDKDDENARFAMQSIETIFGGKVIDTGYGMSTEQEGAGALAKVKYAEISKEHTLIADEEPQKVVQENAETAVISTLKDGETTDATDNYEEEPSATEESYQDRDEDKGSKEHNSWKGWREMPVGHSQAVAALSELGDHADAFAKELKSARSEWIQAKSSSQKIYESVTEKARDKCEDEKVKIINDCTENIEESDSARDSINEIAAACSEFLLAVPKKGDIQKATRQNMNNVENSLVTINKMISERTALYRNLREVQIADTERSRNEQMDRARKDQIERDNQSDRKYNNRINMLESQFSEDIEEGFNKEILRAYSREVMSSRFNAVSYECPVEVPEYVMLGKIGTSIPENDQDEKTVVQAVALQTNEIGIREDGAYTVSIPYAQRLSDGISMLMSYGPADRSYAQSLIQPMLLKLFMSFPAGKLEATMIDPLELGASFSYIPKLAEAPETSRVIDTKIWSKEKDIESAVATLRQRLENMTQAYGGDKESRLKKEVVRALAIADFPVGFNETALKDLNAIVRNSAALGVCVLICANEEELSILKQKNGSLVNEIAQSLVETRVENGRLRLLGDGQERLFIEVDEMNDVLDNKDEILRTISSSIEHTQLKIEHFGSMYKEDIYDSNNWFTGNHDEIAIPLGIKGADTIVKMVLGRGGGSTEHHALIAGQTGAGKSTLLHTLIMSTLISYSPDEVQMYLLDFKEGVEFSAYTRYRLPSLRVIAVNSEREFGLNVLKELCTELETRTKHFTRYGVSDINSYVQLDDAPKIPKLLLIFDEVQELFRNKNESDNISEECLSCINKLVMQGRAMGIHLILACQDFHNCAGLEAYFSQMAIRIAVKGSEEGAASILSADNAGIRTLQNQPAGAAIYNGGGGVESANNFFQVSYINEDERLDLLSRLDAYFTDPYVAEMYEDQETRILLTNAEDNIHNCFNRLILEGMPSIEKLGSSQDGYGLLLGQGFGKKSVFIPELRAKDRENLLVVSKDEKTALSIFELSAMSVLYDELSTTSDKENALIYIINLFAGELNDGECDFEFMSEQFPGQIVMESLEDMEELIDSVYQLILGRSEGKYPTTERVFFMFFGINRARNLRTGGMYDNDSEDEMSAIEKLKVILAKGPKYGVNCIVWGESIQGIETMLGDRYEGLFNKRIAYDLDESSMDILVAESDAKSMHGKTAVYMDTGRDIKNTHFRPYDIPAKVWMERYAEIYDETINEGGR